MSKTEFSAKLLEHGFSAKEVIDDSKYHRFDIKKKGDSAGYYNLDSNGHGVFGNWKTGEQFKYRSGQSEKMTEQERAEASARYREQTKKQKEDTENRYIAAAIEANKMWNEAKAAPADHWYLVKKGIQPHDSRIDVSGTLLIPIFEERKLVNIQRITKSKKLFHSGAKKRGCYSKIDGATDVIFLAEGFSTAASINEATGKLCVIALDAGNLLPIAKIVRKKFGVEKKIIIAADNDCHNETNTGLAKANEAAEAICAEVRFPSFPTEDKDKSDWNDFSAAFGVEALRDELLTEKKTDIIEIVPGQEVMNGHAMDFDVFEHRGKTELPLDLDVDSQGNPKGTIENLERIAKQEGIIFRYNVIRKMEEIIIPNESFSIDNVLNASFARVLSTVKNNGMSTAHIKEYITCLSDKIQFNPVTTWILSKPWDGVSRLAEFYETIQAKNKPLRDIILQRWMLSAIAAAFNPNGVSAHGVLVFQGVQYMGKTSWFKRLAPSSMDVIKDGFILRLDDKDSVYQCVSHWMVELGELEATFRKSDIAQLKAFITADRDIIRRPFAVKESYYARRTVFFASVNPKEFLFDETGNRRFWTIETTAINYNHNLDMQQIWAEFYNLYLDGESWIMTGEEIEEINANNEDFMGADYHEELVNRKFDWKAPNWAWKTVTEISRYLSVQNPKQQDLNRLSKAVKKYNGDKQKRGSGGVRLLYVPDFGGYSESNERSFDERGLYGD